MLICLLYIFFGEISVQIFSSFYIVLLLFLLCFINSLNSEYKTFIRYIHCRYFLPVYYQPFHSLKSVLLRTGDFLIILMNFNLLICSFIDHAFGIIAKKYFHIKMTIFFFYILFCVIILGFILCLLPIRINVS